MNYGHISSQLFYSNWKLKLIHRNDGILECFMMSNIWQSWVHPLSSDYILVSIVLAYSNPRSDSSNKRKYEKIFPRILPLSRFLYKTLTVNKFAMKT